MKRSQALRVDYCSGLSRLRSWGDVIFLQQEKKHQLGEGKETDDSMPPGGPDGLLVVVLEAAIHTISSTCSVVQYTTIN